MSLLAKKWQRCSLRLLGLACLVPLFLGCNSGPPTAEVSGTVSYKGQPLPQGTVTFITEDGRSDTNSIVDGHYTLTRAPVGAVTIEIKTPRAVQKAHKTGMTPGMVAMAKKMSEGGGGAAPGAEPSAAPSKKVIEVPAKYGNKRTSDLKYEVTNGSQTHDINIP